VTTQSRSSHEGPFDIVAAVTSSKAARHQEGVAHRGPFTGALLATTTPSLAGTTTHLKSAGGSAYCSLLVSYDKKQNAANKALETRAQLLPRRRQPSRHSIAKRG